MIVANAVFPRWIKMQRLSKDILRARPGNARSLGEHVQGTLDAAYQQYLDPSCELSFLSFAYWSHSWSSSPTQYSTRCLWFRDSTLDSSKVRASTSCSRMADELNYSLAFGLLQLHLPYFGLYWLLLALKVIYLQNGSLLLEHLSTHLKLLQGMATFSTGRIRSALLYTRWASFA